MSKTVRMTTRVTAVVTLDVDCDWSAGDANAGEPPGFDIDRVRVTACEFAGDLDELLDEEHDAIHERLMADKEAEDGG